MNHVGPPFWLICLLGASFALLSILIFRQEQEWHRLPGEKPTIFRFGYAYAGFVFAVGLLLLIGPILS